MLKQTINLNMDNKILRNKIFIYIMLKMIQWKIESSEKCDFKEFNDTLNKIGIVVTNRKLFFILNSTGKGNLFDIFNNFHFDMFGLFEKGIPSKLEYNGISFGDNSITIDEDSFLKLKNGEVINKLKLEIDAIDSSICSSIDDGIDNIQTKYNSFIDDTLDIIKGRYYTIFLLKREREILKREKKSIKVNLITLKSISTIYSPKPNKTIKDPVTVQNFSDFAKRRERMHPKQFSPKRKNG